MKILDLEIGNVSSFKDTHYCDVCAEAIKINEEYTDISCESMAILHIHHRCAVKLSIVLDAYIRAVNLPLLMTFSAIGKKPEREEVDG